MDAPTADARMADKPPSAQSNLALENNSLVEQEIPNSRTLDQRPKQKIEIDAERIRSSIARLTSNSIGELEGLTCELQKLDEFLKSETGRVQRENRERTGGDPNYNRGYCPVETSFTSVLWTHPYIGQREQPTISTRWPRLTAAAARVNYRQWRIGFARDECRCRRAPELLGAMSLIKFRRALAALFLA